MQKKLLTVAVAGALAAPLAAMADVTVYGTIDTGIRTASKVCQPPDQTGSLTSAAQCATTGSLLSVTEGERTTNRWGLKGSEDLGGGLRANFTLEGQYASDSGGGPGSSAGGANQGIFQRKSIVGLSGGMWSVDLGRDYTVNFKTQGIYDPMSYTYTGITPAAGNNTNGVRSSNLVTAGFRFGTGGIRVDYAMGETAGDTSSGSSLGVNADFAFGPVTVAAAVSQRSADTGTSVANGGIGKVTQQTMNVGGKYKLGAMTFRAGYSQSTYDSDASDIGDTPMILLGFQYDFSSAWSGRFGYYSMEFNCKSAAAKASGTCPLAADKQGSRNWILLAVDYNLSKTTVLYGAVDISQIKDYSITVNGNTGAISASGIAGVAATDGQNVQDGSTGISVGIMHAF